MKQTLTFQRLLLAAGLFSFSPLAGQAQTLTFDDEFNSLDLSGKGAWQPNATWANPDGKNADPSDLSAFFVNPNYAPLAAANPFSITNGVLDIVIKPTPSSLNPADVNNKPYVTGMMQTASKFSQLYGYFEMRAKLPAGNGVGGAFWLLPTDGSWPPEIDVEENLGEDVATVYQTLHTGAGNSILQGWPKVANGNYATTYHTYGVDWEADNITFYLDGKATAQYATPADMHKPMYLILQDNASGPSHNWGKPIDSTTPLPAHFYVDYVRAYAAKPDLSSGGSPTPGGAPATAGLVSGGVYRLSPQSAPSKCLDVAGYSQAEGANVQQYEYKGQTNQQWRLVDTGGGYYKLVSVNSPTGGLERVLNLDGCSTALGSGINQWAWWNGGNDCQRWSFSPVGDGSYVIRPKVAVDQGLDRCLDVAGVSKLDGAKVHLWDYVKGLNQHWQLTLLRTDAGASTQRSALASHGAAPAPSALSVYPNPAGEQLTVTTSLAQAGAVQLSLHDQVGRLVRTRTQTAEAGTQALPLDLRGLPAGLYLLRVQQPGSAAQTRKVTVQP